MNGEVLGYWMVAGAVLGFGAEAALVIWKARERFLALIVAGVFLLVTLQCIVHATKAAGGL